MAMVVYTGGGSNPPYQDETSERSVAPYVGLSNQGATCYLNGLLQTLFMTPEFRRAVYSWTYNSEKDGPVEQCIPLQLQRLFGMLQLSKTAATTIALTKSFGWEGTEVFQQQDVQELLRVLFDALEETLKGTDAEHIIDELYAGELIDYIRCIDVDYQSERIDKFLDFSLAIIPFGSQNAMHSLSECIEMFLRPETLDGENQYYAEKFDKKVDAIKGLKFGKLPQIMSVTLKRFVYDFSGPNIVQKKVNEQVTFPMLLDMNKYVAGRGRDRSMSLSLSSSDSCERGGGRDREIDEYSPPPPPPPGYEFEVFLKRQMELLREDKLRTSAGAADALVGAAQAVAEESGGTSSFDVLGNLIVPGRRQATGGVAAAAAVVSGNLSELPPLPDLVDSSGEKAPDQKEEEAQLEACKHMPVQEEIEKLVVTRGEWIYELYAVLIHSGAIAGGHYYAYIKNLDSKRWYNFNDAYVTEISEDKVCEAWGGSLTSSVYQYPPSSSSSSSSSYGGSSMYNVSGYGSGGRSLSSANAYMLMYRKVSKPGIVPSSLPGDDLVPAYIRDDIRRKIEEEREAQKKAEELRNKLDVHVLWKEVETVVATKKNELFEDFLKRLWKEFKLENEPEFADLKDDHKAVGDIGPSGSETVLKDEAVCSEAVGNVDSTGDTSSKVADLKDDKIVDPASAASGDIGSSEVDLKDDTIGPARDSVSSEVADLMDKLLDGIPLDRIRLRQFSTYYKTNTDAYDIGEYRGKTLESMSFSSYRTLSLEIRGKDEFFEEYFSDGMTINLQEYEPIDDTIIPAKSIRVRKGCTVGGLKDLIALQARYPREKIRLLRLVYYGSGAASGGKCEEIGGEAQAQDTKVLRDVHVYEGATLHFEEITCSLSESRAFEAFVRLRTVVNIRVNKPPAEDFDYLVSADARWPIARLREEVAKEVEIDLGTLRMFKGSVQHGMELRDGCGTVQSVGIYAGTNITVSIGRVAPAGHHRLLLHIYTPPANIVGVNYLPEVPRSESDDLDDHDDVREDQGDDSDHFPSTADVYDTTPSSSSSSSAAVHPETVPASSSSSSAPRSGGAAAARALSELKSLQQDHDHSTPDDFSNNHRATGSYFDVENDKEGGGRGDAGSTATDPLTDDDEDDGGVGDAVLGTKKKSGYEGEEEWDEYNKGSGTGYEGEEEWEDYTKGPGGSSVPVAVATLVGSLDAEDGDNFYPTSHVNDDDDWMVPDFSNQTQNPPRTSSNVQRVTYTIDIDGSGGLTSSSIAVSGVAVASIAVASDVVDEDGDGEDVIVGMYGEDGLRLPSPPGNNNDRDDGGVSVGDVAIDIDGGDNDASSDTDKDQRGTMVGGEAAAGAGGESVNASGEIEHVEPNDFGQRSIELAGKVKNFELIVGIDGVFANLRTPTEELRKEIADRLKSLGMLPESASPRRVRVRDKFNNTATRILRDGLTLEQNTISNVYNEKAMCIQILDEEESLDALENGDVVLLVQKWDRATWSLGPRIEVLIQGDLTVREISKRLAKMFDIPYKSMRTLVAPAEWEILLYDLQLPCPFAGSNRYWFDGSQERKKLRELSQRFQDGDLLLLQNAEEPLRPLTRSEQLSVDICSSKDGVGAGFSSWGVASGWNGASSSSSSSSSSPSTSNKTNAYVSYNNCNKLSSIANTGSSANNYNKYSTSYSSTTTGSTSYNNYGPRNGGGGGGGGGIKIKTFKDRQREDQESKEGNSSTSPVPDDATTNDISSVQRPITEFSVNFDEVADGDLEGGGRRPQEVLRGADMALLSDLV